MQVASMIYGLRLESHLQAAASHAEVHSVHVDEARILLNLRVVKLYLLVV